MHKRPLQTCQNYKYDLRGHNSFLFFLCAFSTLSFLIFASYSLSMSGLDPRFEEDLCQRDLGYVIPPSMTTTHLEEDPATLVAETPVPTKTKKGQTSGTSKSPMEKTPLGEF